MTNREKAHIKKVEELMAQAETMDAAAVDRALGILRAVRDDIAVQVAQTEWEAYYIPQAKEAFERAILRFEGQMKNSMESDSLIRWDAGIDMIDAPLAKAGIRILAPEIPRSTLTVLQGYSADLIEGLSADAMRKINHEITMGVLGQRPHYEVMKEIDRILGIETGGGISWRAETIVRTEMAHVHSIARELRKKSVIEANPDLPWRKKWIHSGAHHARPNHAALSGKEVPVEENFPGNIPYPHAPGLPAAEVVNCGCSHVLTCDWDALPGAWEPVEYTPRAAA